MCHCKNFCTTLGLGYTPCYRHLLIANMLPCAQTVMLHCCQASSYIKAPFMSQIRQVLLTSVHIHVLYFLHSDQGPLTLGPALHLLPAHSLPALAPALVPALILFLGIDLPLADRCCSIPSCDCADTKTLLNRSSWLITLLMTTVITASCLSPPFLPLPHCIAVHGCGDFAVRQRTAVCIES